MAYLPEVSKGQRYLIEGEVYRITSVRATNVCGPNDFIISVSFSGSNARFEERIQNVIDNPDFELLRESRTAFLLRELRHRLLRLRHRRGLLLSRLARRLHLPPTW